MSSAHSATLRGSWMQPHSPSRAVTDGDRNLGWPRPVLATGRHSLSDRHPGDNRRGRASPRRLHGPVYVAVVGRRLPDHPFEHDTLRAGPLDPTLDLASVVPDTMTELTPAGTSPHLVESSIVSTLPS
jgi:hypothetical protein